MKSGVTAADWAEQQVTAVRDDPAGRLVLMQRCYYGPYGSAPRHLPYRRAATSFMRWQLQRGLLQPPSSDRPGSPWWRAVNERILRDGCEAVGLSGDLPGPTSSRTVHHWLSFADYPTSRPGTGRTTAAWSPLTSSIVTSRRRRMPPSASS